MKPIPHDIVVIELGLEEQKSFEEARPSEYDLSAKPAGLVLRGFNVDIVYQRITTDHALEADTGEFDLVGAPASVAKAMREPFEPGSLAFIGMPSIVAASRRDGAGAGAFALAGGGIGFRFGYQFVAGVGPAFTLTGGAAAFRASSEFSAGEFQLSGQPMGPKIRRLLAAAQGTLALTGGAAALRIDKTEALAPGSFSVAGGQMQIGAERPTAQQSVPTFALAGSPVDLIVQAAAGDENHIIFATPARMGDVELLNAAPATLVHQTIDGRGAAVLRTGAVGATTRAYVVWKGKAADGVYRYLVSLKGTQPSSSVRRGPLPFARAAFTDAGALSNGYLSGPNISSGAENRYVLNKVVAGVETNIIAENFNRTGTWGQWKWWEIKVEGSVISHRTYAEDTAEGSIPAWQTVADTTFGAGGLHGIGFQQGANNNYLAIAEMEFIPSHPEFRSTISGDGATWSGEGPASNTLENNTARWAYA